MTVGSQIPELGKGRLKKDQCRSLHFSFVSYNKENMVLSYFLFQFSFHVILTSYIMAFMTKEKSEMTSQLNNGYDVSNLFC